MWASGVQYFAGGLTDSPLYASVGLIIEEVWAVESLYSEEEPPLKTLMMTIPLLLTNVVATTLIGLQVWYECKFHHAG